MAKNGRLRNAIFATLRENPQGLTASEIIDRLPVKQARKVSTVGHVSNLIKGMKHINKRRISIANSHYSTYDVNQYFYEEEGAEI